jgi:hypothetical protein
VDLVTGSAIEADHTFYNLTIDDTGARTVTIYSSNTIPGIVVSNIFVWDAAVLANAANIQIGYLAFMIIRLCMYAQLPV